MVSYVRDESVKASGHDHLIVGAYLVKAKTFNETDTWHACHETDELLKRNPQEVIYGGSEAEIESEVWKRHPVEGSAVTLVTKYGSGWQVERVPRLMYADLNLLQEACALHKRVLVGNDLIQQLGGPERLLGMGFLLVDRSSRCAQVVRYNPRQVVINRWKKDVEDLGQYFRPEFPPELVGQLFEAIRPEHWHAEHPYTGYLKTYCEVIGEGSGRRGSWGSHHRSRRGHSEQVNLASAPKTILTFVQISGRLSRGDHRTPWRRTCQWKELLERLVEYIHGVEESGDADWKKLAKWVRCEAHAAKVRIPRRKKLPPRPTFRKRAVRRRHQPRLEPVPV